MVIVVRLLLIAEDTSQFINRNYHYLEQELAKWCDLMVWRESGSIQAILKRFSRKPDFILIINDMGHRLSPLVKGLKHQSIPTGLVINDVHRLTKAREHYISKNKVDYLFTVGWGQSVQTYPHLQHKMQWFPHFVQTEIYKDYSLTRDIPLLLTGAVNDYYPLREKIVNAYAEDSRFIYHPHPGYRDYNRKEERQHLIGENYAREINRSNIFFTCPSTLDYPVMKYYEALACRTLLLAPTFKELEDLGFIPGKHFVAIDENNFKEKAAYYLAHEKEREQIATEGYNFIRKNHTVRVRAKELIHTVETLLSSH